ncbi:MAG TPA: PilZ domain-containing protein [Turneriella sp.]|nr:PilZ domain-containing protein [Turneriella sp.]
MPQANDRRSQHRVTAGAYIEYRVTIDSTQVKDAIMSDISEGGLMLLVEEADLGRKFNIDDALSGHIIHDRTKFNFPYTGKVAWLQPREMRTRKFVAMGIRFDDGIELPAQIYAILMADHDF